MGDEKTKWPEPELTRKKHIPLKEYGLLKVIELPDGTSWHINTKKGEENLRVYHSSGSYDEYNSDGSKISISSNNAVSYAKNGMTITADASSDSKAGGHMRIAFDHDSHVEFRKNASIVVGGKTSLAALGELKIAAKGNLYLGSDAKIVMNAGKGMEMNAHDGRIEMEASGVIYAHSKSGDIHLEAAKSVKSIAGENVFSKAAQDVIEEAAGNITETARADISSSAQGNVTETAQGNVENTASGEVKYKATGKASIKGAVTKIQEGGSQTSSTSDTFV
jgi:uncharacterized protein (DUF2345 family)